MEYIFFLYWIVCLSRNFRFQQQIKYDKRDKKLWFRGALISSIIFIPAVVWFVLSYNNIKTEEEWVWMLILFFLDIIMSQIFLVVWLQYGECVLYLKRLQKHGYIIPDEKMNYAKRMDQLPREKNWKKYQGVNKESVALACLCWTSALVALGLLIWIIQKYAYTMNFVIMCVTLFALLIAGWICGGSFCWKQRLDSEYHDDTDYDEQRKQRLHFISGTTTIIVLWGASVWLISLLVGR